MVRKADCTRRKLSKINELSLIAPTADEGLIENHDSLLLTDNHYILTGYRQRKERINGRESSVVTLLLQEIKNNRVIFEWNSGDHPELIKESLTACNYKKTWITCILTA